MRRILISSPSINAEKNVSGVASVTRQIMCALGQDAAFTHLEIGSEQGGSRISRLFGSLAKTARAIFKVAEAPFDILHSNTAMNPKSILRDLATIAAARLRGKRVLLHIHGGTFIHEEPTFPLRLAMRLLFHLSSSIIVLTRTQLLFFTHHYPETAGKTEFIYNGIDMAGHAMREDHATQRLQAVFIGRLAADKGIDVLISACRRLKESDGIDMHVFGAGDLLPSVLALAEEKPFVKYRGLFQPSESRTVLRDFDVLIITSSREGLPMALIEAMSVGTVPLCPASSSFPELIADGETGLLFAPDGSEAIAGALIRLESDAQARRRMGRAAYEFAVANFDARKNFRKFLAIYQRLCP